MDASLEQVPGWHGKLPSLGDFASRRLPPVFVEAWDAWLAGCLAILQADPHWLDHYLGSPTWRFLLMPGVIDARTWCGVLMPSVDRVGRYYPFTVATAVSGPLGPQSTGAVWNWLVAVEAAALEALEQEWEIATLEAALEGIGQVSGFPEPSELNRKFAWGALLSGKACWLAAPAGAEAEFFVSRGLQESLSRCLFRSVRRAQ